MAKRTTELDDNGRPFKKTRHQQASEREIPWTKGPTTGWQKFVRKAVG
jgi:hypothetical protein